MPKKKEKEKPQVGELWRWGHGPVAGDNSVMLIVQTSRFKICYQYLYPPGDLKGHLFTQPKSYFSERAFRIS